jgi:hypothetical protein
MKTWFKFYEEDVVRWDLLLKLPTHKEKGSLSMINFFPQFVKSILYIRLKLNGDSDFKIIKALKFYYDLFAGIELNLAIFKGSSRLNEKGKTEKNLVIGLICRRPLLSLLVQKLSTYILFNILKKQVPLHFGIDDLGVSRILIKDIGELGIDNMYYDYFGWRDPLVLEFYTSVPNRVYTNILISYLNLKFIV